MIRPILVLAAVNLGAALLLMLLVGSALAGSLSVVPYRIGLVGLLVAYVALWVKLERDFGRGRHLVLRGVRALAALAIAFLVTPMVVLAPIFSIESQLPEEAGFDTISARSIELVHLATQALMSASLLAWVAAFVVAAVVRLRRGRGTIGP